MRCLMCAKEMNEGSFKDIFYSEDPLCEECRNSWKKEKIHFELKGVKGYADYVYDSSFSSCLIQFKECGDEALKDVFLFDVLKQFKRRYSGRTLLLMPSSKKKLEERGFHHLKEIFECTEMKMIDAFEKENDESQKKLTKVEREEMVHEIHLKKDIKLPKKLLLVDDTITTGSTLKGALNCLNKNKHDIQIYCVSANKSWL